MAGRGCVVVDEDRRAVYFDAAEADRLWRLTGGLDRATVSACPSCRSRIVACVALNDLLEDAPLFERADELRELADDAPTLHLYVVDEAPCSHRAWRDPGYDEWSDAVDDRPRLRRV